MSNKKRFHKFWILRSLRPKTNLTNNQNFFESIRSGIYAVRNLVFHQTLKLRNEMITEKTYLWGLRPKTTVLQCSQHLCKFRLQWSLGNCFLLGRCCSPRKNFLKLVILRGLRPKRFFPSNDNAYLYSNSWNTPHSKKRTLT